MALHPGEQGVCNDHGTYDEYCGQCANRRTGSERRMAVSAQVPPSGNGAVVLDALLNRLANMASVSSIPFEPSKIVKEDLIARSAQGEKKYKTVLRTKNGRKAGVDLYQEVLDGAMYAQQARLEGDEKMGRFVEPLLSFAAQIGAELNTR